MQEVDLFFSKVLEDGGIVNIGDLKHAVNNEIEQNTVNKSYLKNLISIFEILDGTYAANITNEFTQKQSKELQTRVHKLIIEVLTHKDE